MALNSLGRNYPEPFSAPGQKQRWIIERGYEELKQELGLRHYEGSGWRGFHHHATLCITAYEFLVAERSRFPPLVPVNWDYPSPSCRPLPPSRLAAFDYSDIIPARLLPFDNTFADPFSGNSQVVLLAVLHIYNIVVLKLMLQQRPHRVKPFI